MPKERKKERKCVKKLLNFQSLKKLTLASKLKKPLGFLEKLLEPTEYSGLLKVLLLKTGKETLAGKTPSL